MVQTKIDEFVAVARKGDINTFDFIAAKLRISKKGVEAIAQVLEKGGLLEIHYPINMLQQPFVTMKPEALEEKERREKAEKELKGKETAAPKSLDKYQILADHVPAEVLIFKRHNAYVYQLALPALSLDTRIFLDRIRDELSNVMPVKFSEVSDVEKTQKLRGEFYDGLNTNLAKFEMPENERTMLAGLLLHKMFGLGEMEVLMQDDFLEEVTVNNAKTPIGVYHRKYGWLKTNIFLPDEEEILNYASQIGRKVGRQIAVLTPIMDARLDSGDRVNATIMPISAHGNTMTIRRFARNPWTIVSLITPPNSTMNSEMAAMLWQGIHYELNIIVAGGTASGKTSALNALSAFIPPNQRIITIEDTRELVLPDFQWNWIPLLTRNANPEGLGEVGMLELLQTALRMRPDRIILGEMRKQSEAEVLFEAMHTGHSVYSTMHADTSAQVIRRLTTPPFSIPTSDMESLHLILVQYRDRRKNLRRTLEIAEVTAGAQSEQLVPNIIYRWRSRKDTFDKIAEQSKFFSQLNLHTGMTKDEIVDDLKDRTDILDWMQKNKISDINDVGKVMQLYYSEPDTVLEAAKKDTKLARLI